MPSIQNNIIISNIVYILPDLDDAVQEVEFEKTNPTFIEKGLVFWVQATYHDSLPLVI